MAYKLEHVPSDHVAVLVETMHKWSNSQPDVYIISKEGHKIYTHKLLVSFYSPTLGNILRAGLTNDMPGVSIPASSNSIVNLLKVLATGISISNDKGDLLAVSKAAEAMNIEIENWQIGVKNRGVTKNVKNESKSSLKALKKSIEKKVPYQSLDQGVSENFEEKKYPCADCGKQFGRKDHLNRHALTHSGASYPCDICGSSFKRTDGLKAHLLKVHDTELIEEDVKIKVENESEHSPNELDGEGQQERNLNDNKQIGDQIYGVSSLNEDRQKNGNMTSEPTDSPSCESESKYNCNQCEKVFKNPQHLKRHEAVHSGVKFSCIVCPSSFSRKDKLNAHVRKKHSQLAYEDAVSEEAVINEVNEIISNELPESRERDAIYSSEDITDEALNINETVDHSLESQINEDVIREEESNQDLLA